MGKQQNKETNSNQEVGIPKTNELETLKTSPEIKEDNRPIDKYFWFNLSRKWVIGGIENVIEICGRLITAIAWFFGLGSSGFILSILLGNESFKGLDLTFMFIPIILFFISYGLAVLGQTVAIHREFDPNKHDTIRIAYNKVMATSKIYIILSAALLMSAIISIPIIINNTVDNKKEIPINKTNNELVLQGTYSTKDTIIQNAKKQFITKVNISGTLQKASQIRLQIEQGTSQLTRLKIEDVQLFPDTTSGFFFLDIPINKIVSQEEQFYISVEFPLDPTGYLRRYTKLITASK